MDTDWPTGSFVSRLAPEARKALIGTGRLQEFGAGQQLMQQGEISRDLYVILSGWLKITCVTEEGKTAFLAIRSRGDLVGEMAGLDGSPRVATVTAAGLVQAYGLHADQMRLLMAQRADVATAFAASISEKLRWATRRRVDVIARRPREALARVLLELIRTYPRDTVEGVGLSIPLTQPELSALVGVSEATLQRTLGELRSAGIVLTNYRSPVIADVEGLRALAGDIA